MLIEQLQKLLTTALVCRRAHVAKFLDGADTACLYLFAEGKDLVAVWHHHRPLVSIHSSLGWCSGLKHTHLLRQAIKPPSKLKKKAVYFAKLAKAALTFATIDTLVSARLPCVWHTNSTASSKFNEALTGRLGRVGRGAAGGAVLAERCCGAAAAEQPHRAGRLV